MRYRVAECPFREMSGQRRRARQCWPNHLRQKGPRESAAQHQQRALCSHTPLLRGQTRKDHESDTAGKRFRYTSGQVWRGRAKEKEAGRIVGPVNQHPEQFEEVGSSLNFVDDYQTGEFFQCPHGCRQSADVHSVFEIKIGGWFTLRDLPRKCGFAALARTQEGCNWVNAEGSINAFYCPGRGIMNPLYH